MKPQNTENDWLLLAIGDVVSGLIPDERALAEAARSRYDAFLHSECGRSTDLEVRAAIDPDAEFMLLPDIEVGVEDGVIRVSRGDFDGVIDLPSGRAEVKLNWPEYAIVGFDCFLRVCYSLLAVSRGGLLVHSASVARDGEGLVFPGVSGSGKSTVAGICRDAGCTVLSDEISLLRRSGSGWTVYGTPFHGDLGTAENYRAPVRGLYFLKQARENGLALLENRAALTHLMRSVVFFGEASSLMPAAFEVCCDLASSVPCREMSFRKDSEFLAMIDGLEDE
ncbi:MAG: hypothetical protein KBC96_15345 [Armatimonadetes bacterium]|nr:hypothetical protein [Armatimonadota bacterium]